MTRTPLADRPLPFIARGARAATLALCVAAAGLSACGGPTRAVESFKPTRVVVLGDELSAVDQSTGAKYGINALVSGSTELACQGLPLWSQSVASAFGLSVCPDLSTDSTRLVRAHQGARATDLNAQLTGVDVGPSDLVTVSIGYNDVLTLYRDRSSNSPSELTAQAEQAGLLAATEICQVLRRGARAVVTTAPDLGLSPFGLQEMDKGALLTQLTDQFNAGLRSLQNHVKVKCDDKVVDGWQFGLLLGQEKTKPGASTVGLSNVTEAACNGASGLGDCTTATLKPGASASGWLWATDTLPSPAWHSLVGSSATSLAFYPF